MQLPKGRFERLIVKAFLWFVIILGGLFTVFIAGSVWEVYQKEQRARAELSIAQNAYETLEKRQASLRTTLDALEHERGMETEFRTRFPVVREGEEVLILVDSNRPLDDASAERTKPWWAPPYNLFRW
jgi:cell division protein FtsB